MKLSIIVPIYNEEKTILKILERIDAVDLGDIEKETVLIDDFSTDSTRDILKSLENRYRVFYQEKNQGKGAALRRGFKEATGDIFLIQDADLEYSPGEYPKLLEPILSGRADVVYGSRFIGGGSHRVLYFWHLLGNKFLTLLSNMFTNLTLTDMETCYKVFVKKVIETIGPTLQSNRFGFEPEITAKIAKNKFRIYEVGISYSGRTYEEGKKINWKDAISALWCIIKFNFFD
ncbi:MAG: glycosyl transferase [Parcubacteria group bacterium CG10_big_fil_rev_8_21_14_0_10_36_14]|nr:MAG: glycosyl transferase [Parcubacteria group bacterium CG10_big_fil_rev_8_21_14_0_10_36_14]